LGKLEKVRTKKGKLTLKKKSRAEVQGHLLISAAFLKKKEGVPCRGEVTAERKLA